MYRAIGRFSFPATKRALMVTGACVGVVAGAATAQAQAQAADSAPGRETGRVEASHTLEQVVVTARKRSESMLDVPVAMSAISKEELQNNVVSNLDKIGELAPQVMIGRGVTGTGAAITMRGISSSTNDSGLDQSVAVSIDGVPISRSRIVHTAQFDLQQVEVLQGPQALFFGKNSPAGVISLQTADPTDVFEAHVTAGYEYNAKEKFVETALSGPLTETLKARLAIRYDDMDGWLKNVAQPIASSPINPGVPLPGTPQGNASPMGHYTAGRLTLLWEPTDDFNAELKLTRTQERLNGNNTSQEGYCIGGQTVPTTLGQPSLYYDCAANGVKAENALPPEFAVNYPHANGGVPYLDSDYTLAGLTLNKTFGEVTVSSTTGYYNQDHAAAAIGNSGEFAALYAAEGESVEQISQELRLNTDFAGPFNFMVGAYFEHATRTWYNVPDLLNVFNPVANNYVSTYTTSDSDNDSYSAFAQIRWGIAQGLELAAGARYTHDDKKTTLLSLYNNPLQVAAFGLYPAGQPIDARHSNDNVSPEVTLTWKPTPDQTLYAGYKTGYKAGGIANPALLPANSTPANRVFGPEEVDGFEIGYKALLGSTVRLDLTAYRYDYDGLQVTAFDAVTLIATIRNAAAARTTGITGSILWEPTDRLSLNGNVGYNRARYVSFPNAQCYTGQTAALGCVGGVQDLSGEALNRAPNLTYRVGADYRADLVAGWTAALSISAAYNGSYQSAADYSPGGEESSYWLLNAALRLSPEDGKYQLALIGRNLNDSYHKIYSNLQPLGAATQYIAVFNRPREVVLQATVNF